LSGLNDRGSKLARGDTRKNMVSCRTTFLDQSGLKRSWQIELARVQLEPADGV